MGVDPLAIISANFPRRIEESALLVGGMAIFQNLAGYRRFFRQDGEIMRILTKLT